MQPGDVDAFAAYRADPELARYQGWEPMTREQAAEFVEANAAVDHLVPGEWVQLAIADAISGELLGDVGLHVDRDQSAAEVGFTLARQHQGRGHATRAVHLATDLVFAHPLVTEIRGVTDAVNLPSIAVLRRAGFVRYGQRDVIFKGQPCTEWLFRKLRPATPAN